MWPERESSPLPTDDDADVAMMIEDVSSALRPYGLMRGDCRSCAALLRRLADRLESCSTEDCPLASSMADRPRLLN